jgi:hypothetical protein
VEDGLPEGKDFENMREAIIGVGIPGKKVGSKLASARYKSYK